MTIQWWVKVYWNLCFVFVIFHFGSAPNRELFFSCGSCSMKLINCLAWKRGLSRSKANDWVFPSNFLPTLNRNVQQQIWWPMAYWPIQRRRHRMDVDWTPSVCCNWQGCGRVGGALLVLGSWHSLHQWCRRLGALKLQTDGLAGQGLQENRHASPKMEHQVEGALFLDVVVNEVCAHTWAACQRRWATADPGEMPPGCRPWVLDVIHCFRRLRLERRWSCQ